MSINAGSPPSASKKQMPRLHQKGPPSLIWDSALNPLQGCVNESSCLLLLFPCSLKGHIPFSELQNLKAGNAIAPAQQQLQREADVLDFHSNGGGCSGETRKLKGTESSPAVLQFTQNVSLEHQPNQSSAVSKIVKLPAFYYVSSIRWSIYRTNERWTTETRAVCSLLTRPARASSACFSLCSR